MITTGDIIARRLYEAGCRFVFGIPGGEVLALMNAFENAGLRFILTKHENNAGFMAEGVYHLSKTPGILLTTLGPGVANAVNVVANAYLERIPLLLFTGRIETYHSYSYTHQVFDHQKVLQPITKASFHAQEPIEVLIDQALSIALEDQKGPVHIDISPSVVEKQHTEYPPTLHPRRPPTIPATSPDLKQAQHCLAQAQKPVMIAGFDVINQQAEKEVAEFVTAFNIPLITTYKAKGILSEDHPLSLGGAGLSPRVDEYLLPLLKQSDLILLVGYDPVEMRIGWRNPWLHTQTVIEFSVVRQKHAMHHSSFLFIGSLGPSLKHFAYNIKNTKPWPNQLPTQIRQNLQKHFQPQKKWNPTTIFQTTRKVVPKNTIVTIDTGAHGILLKQIWTCYSSQTLLQSNGLSTMGCALPLAVGAKLAAPHQTVIAFIGDASLEMVLGELATVRDLKLQILFIVLGDRQLALIESKQRAKGYKKIGVEFGNTDFSAIAQAMNGYGITVEDTQTLTNEIEKSFSRDRFTLIFCPIKPNSYDRVI